MLKIISQNSVLKNLRLQQVFAVFLSPTILLLASCSSGQFNSDESKDDKKSGEESSSQSSTEESTSSEPVMVGGAYLACIQVSDASGDPRSDGLQVGCAVTNLQRDKILPLSDFNPRWTVVDSKGVPLSGARLETSSSAEYHQLITIQPSQQNDARVDLILDGDKKTQTLSRNFKNLDKFIIAKHERDSRSFLAVMLAEAPQYEVCAQGKIAERSALGRILGELNGLGTPDFNNLRLRLQTRSVAGAMQQEGMCFDSRLNPVSQRNGCIWLPVQVPDLNGRKVSGFAIFAADASFEMRKAASEASGSSCRFDL